MSDSDGNADVAMAEVSDAFALSIASGMLSEVAKSLSERRVGTLACMLLVNGSFTYEDYDELVDMQDGTDSVKNRALAAAYRVSGNDEFTLENYAAELPPAAQVVSDAVDFFCPPERAGDQAYIGGVYTAA